MVRQSTSAASLTTTSSFLICPTISPTTLAQGYTFPYRWNKAHPARVGLLPRRGDVDEIIWCEVEPCYVFHVANSFQNDDGSVTIDCCAYESCSRMALMDLTVFLVGLSDGGLILRLEKSLEPPLMHHRKNFHGSMSAVLDSLTDTLGSLASPARPSQILSPKMHYTIMILRQVKNAAIASALILSAASSCLSPEH